MLSIIEIFDFAFKNINTSFFMLIVRGRVRGKNRHRAGFETGFDEPGNSKPESGPAIPSPGF